jgi:hypothetical protein
LTDAISGAGDAAIGGQSCGGLVAMRMFLWLKSRNKIILGIYMAIPMAIMTSVMVQQWYDLEYD